MKNKQSVILFLSLFLIFGLINCTNRARSRSNNKTSEQLPSKINKNEFIILSWNIQDFGKTITDKQFVQISKLIRRADLIAIQEVVAGYGGSQAVAKLASELNRRGSKWNYSISAPTNSGRKKERYAYIWKTKKIKAKTKGTLVQKLQNNITREPYYQEFYFNNNSFSIYNYHAKKHRDNPTSEIETLANYIVNLPTGRTILVGDFNLSFSAPVYNIFYSNNFKSTHKNLQTTLKKKCKKGKYLYHSIDNIFYTSDFTQNKGSTLDFIQNCSNLEEYRKISDHLPVYSLLEINPSSNELY